MEKCQFLQKSVVDVLQSLWHMTLSDVVLVPHVRPLDKIGFPLHPIVRMSRPVTRRAVYNGQNHPLRSPRGAMQGHIRS